MRCDVCGMDLRLFDTEIEQQEHRTDCFEQMMSEADLAYDFVNLTSMWEQQ